MRLHASVDGLDLGAGGRPVALAFGAFDGVHRGHRQLIRRVVEWAENHKGVPAILTFANHPLSVLAPAYCPKLLLSAQRKADLFGQLGVGESAIVEFTPDIARISAGQFVSEILFRRMGMRHIVCGYDSRFGEGGRGDREFLIAEGLRLGFTVESLEAVREGGAALGSRLVRELLLIGEVERAADILERPHELTGIVVEGDRRGRQLGFPTANLLFDDAFIVPANGVYAIWADVENRRYGGMMNIGFRPTFDGQAIVAEAHLFSFDRQIYGKAVTVYFVSRLRGEMKFDGVDALRHRLENDRHAALDALRLHGEDPADRFQI